GALRCFRSATVASRHQEQGNHPDGHSVPQAEVSARNTFTRSAVVEQEDFDWFTNTLATECSRRSVLRGLAGGDAIGLFTPVGTSKVGPPVVAPHYDLGVASPIPLAEESLYLTDQAVGWDDWPEDDDGWTYADELLVNDGLGQGEVFLAPYQPEVTDYAVEAEIRLRGATGGTSFYGFGLAARVAPEGAASFGGIMLQGKDGGPDAYVRRTGSVGPVPFFQAYFEAVRDENDLSSRTAFDPGFDTWHTFRLEAERKSLRLLIDGRVTAEAEEDQTPAPGRVGLWSSGLQAEVRRFAVLALPEVSSATPVAKRPV
ncbi:MAG TPA: family 16 glycoside hydrolase, partial [Thermomicrobiales bacterium]|nr:family 16 glycoside hydrolase [Thermomicrobiales bacterium]